LLPEPRPRSDASATPKSVAEIERLRRVLAVAGEDEPPTVAEEVIAA